MSQLNEKQVAALNFVISGHNLLILGPARTGKSFLVREIVGKCIEKGIRVSLTCTTDVIRQSECEFITAIQEVAVGAVTNGSKKFIEKLDRPLPDGDSSIKLFATSDRVDDFNRDSILEFIGPVYEFISNDTGEKRYLSHILAPHILWLKIGAPVILLRNLSTKLVNGLRGKVFDIQDNIPVVEFPSVNLKVPVQRVKFSVFSRAENKDIAVREQLPVKLAFALTIHKSLGMTLDKIGGVDCSGIFKPGQLGVAIGRARTSTGLRVINFSQRACMPHPESVETFLLLPSKEPMTDKSCCQIVRSVEDMKRVQGGGSLVGTDHCIFYLWSRCV